MTSPPASMYTTSTRVEGQPAPSAFVINDGRAFAAQQSPQKTSIESSHFSHPHAKLIEGSFAQHEYGEQGSDRQPGEASQKREVMHKIRHDILCGVGEFAGTFLFLLCSFLGAQSAIYNRSVGEPSPVVANDNETILYISISFGMSLLVVAWIFFRITGSAFNPAVTFSLWMVGGCDFRRAAGVIVAQLLGGIAAAGVAKGFTLGEFSVGNRIAEGISYRQAFGIEMFATALLVFTVLMLAAEKSRTTFLAPVGIGLALFIGHIASVGWTGAGINPARTLGPDVVNGSFASYTWLYYVGQISGALVATLLYILLKSLDYQSVVGDIDGEVADNNGLVLALPVAKAIKVLPRVPTKHSQRSSRSREKEVILEEV